MCVCVCVCVRDNSGDLIDVLEQPPKPLLVLLLHLHSCRKGTHATHATFDLHLRVEDVVYLHLVSLDQTQHGSRGNLGVVTAMQCIYMNNHIYSTLFKTQERESDRRSKEIEQRKESQKNTNKTRTCDPKY